MKAAWVAEMLARADEKSRIKFDDLLISRKSKVEVPVSNEEIGLKFFRWLDYERRALAQ